MTPEEIRTLMDVCCVRIQIDRSGQGHNWRDVPVDELRPDAVEALVREDGDLYPGDEATVGGMPYRVVAERAA